jgi:hypothetical protein
MNWLRCHKISFTPKTMSAVLELCRSSPLTQLRMPSWLTSATSSAVAIHGPSGLNVSQHLPLDHWPPDTSSWNVRSLTSFAMV